MKTNRFFALLLLIGLAVAAVCGQGPIASNKPVPAARPGPDLELFSAHSLLIAKELNKKNNPAWAGVYRMGDQTLAVTRVKGFAWNVDAPGPLPLFTPPTLPEKYPEGAPLYFDYGGVEEVEGVIALYPLENGATSLQLVPVKWGERRYLVQVARLTAFAEAVNRSCDANTKALREFFAHERDKDKPFGGRIVVAPQFDSYFVAQPLVNVVAIKDLRPAVIDQTDATITLAVVNAGSKAGLKEGQKLYHRFLLPEDSAIVKSVSEDKAEIEVTQKNRRLGGPKAIDSTWQFTLNQCN